LEVKPLPTVACDRVRVAQVLRNLITNGVKYNTSEHKRIEVGAADGAVYGRDNGIGIPGGQKQEVWGVFKGVRRGGVCGGGAGGGGGGRVWVESKPGEGSTFFFTLSADERAADQKREQDAGPTQTGAKAGQTVA